jgi:hypothetical protein
MVAVVVVVVVAVVIAVSLQQQNFRHLIMVILCRNMR